MMFMWPKVCHSHVVLGPDLPCHWDFRAKAEGTTWDLKHVGSEVDALSLFVFLNLQNRVYIPSFGQTQHHIPLTSHEILIYPYFSWINLPVLIWSMHGTSSTKPPSKWPAPGSSSTSPEGETAISASWELEPQKAVMWLKQCHVYHPFSWEWCHHTKQKMVMTGGWFIVLPT